MRVSIWLIAGTLLLGAAASASGQAIEKMGETMGPSGLPLPRFVSLSADEINMRSGPGRQYPILWVYKRRGLPVEVTAEYGAWRRVRDADGTVGWMHGNLLSGRRTAIISGVVRDLRASPSDTDDVALRAEPGVIADIRECEQGWCRLSILGTSAWLRPAHFWGVYQNESVR